MQSTVERGAHKVYEHLPDADVEIVYGAGGARQREQQLDPMPAREKMCRPCAERYQHKGNRTGRRIGQVVRQNASHQQCCDVAMNRKDPPSRARSKYSK